MYKKYIVTGGAGFIGSTLVDYLINQDKTVVIIDNLSTGKRENINLKAQFIHCDLSTIDQNELNYYFSNTDTVFHCAALPNVQYSLNFPHKSNRSNVDCTIKTLEACRINNVKKVIYSSSSSVYGDPTHTPTNELDIIQPLSPYALQKYIGEQYCSLYYRLYGLNCIILRYFNVYGDRMTDKGSYVSVLSAFFKAIKNQQPLNIVNDGNQTRDFIHVNDVVQANLLSISSDIPFDIMNIGYGKNYSINNIAEWFGADRQYLETRIEPKITLADISKAKKLLSWKPTIDLKTWIGEQLHALHR